MADLWMEYINSPDAKIFGEDAQGLIERYNAQKDGTYAARVAAFNDPTIHWVMPGQYGEQAVATGYGTSANGTGYQIVDPNNNSVIDKSTIKQSPEGFYYAPTANNFPQSSGGWFDNLMTPDTVMAIAATMAGGPMLGGAVTGATRAQDSGAGLGGILMGAAKGGTLGWAGGEIASGLDNITGYQPSIADSIWSESASPLSSWGTQAGIKAGTNYLTGIAKNAIGGMFGSQNTSAPYGQYTNNSSGQTGSNLGASNMADSSGIDWGNLVGALGGGALTNYLGNENSNYAAQLANNIKFKPYAISSDIGSTSVDANGQLISKLSPEFAAGQQGMLGQVAPNLAAAQADPQLAAQDAYNKMQQLSSFGDQQSRQALENRLLQQGMLGSTGGGNQMQAYLNSLNDRNVNQQLQSINLGQTLSNNAMNRAGQAWTGALAPTAAMAGQTSQAGQFGNAAQTGQIAGANLMNNAYQSNLKNAALAGTNVLGSSGVGTSVGNWLGGNIGNIGNAVGNWLSGSGTGYSTDQLNQLLSQQDGLNWSGVPDVSAGSAQDMMLNDQWNWSW